MAFDRYGGYTDELTGQFRDGGDFVAQTGTDFAQRSLPQSSGNRPLTTYVVVREIPNVQSGQTAPWFGSPGGGFQHKLPNSINYLLDNDFIRILE